METNKPTWTWEILSLVILLVTAVLIAVPGSSFQIGPNNRNVTIDTIVNITNSFPEIISITVIPDTITLNAGTTTLVVVNTTVRDFEGFGDISEINATFFDGNVAGPASPDDNNNHYSNGSCTFVSGSGFLANFTCHFNVEYYANNGTNWTANVTARDSQNFTGSNSTNATVNALLALNLTPLIDYGDMAVGDVSIVTEQANVTNFGNTLINVSVYGFGNATGDGLAMICSERNISIDNERFSTNSTEPFATMDILAAAAQQIPGFQIPQRTNDTAGGETLNSTYWRLRIPVATNPAGQCNGSIVFQAELP